MASEWGGCYAVASVVGKGGACSKLIRRDVPKSACSGWVVGEGLLWM